MISTDFIYQKRFNKKSLRYYTIKHGHMRQSILLTMNLVAKSYHTL